MSWDFLVWLLGFVLQSALLGFMMYGLINLSDLENDFINPHDSASGINRFIVPEYVLQTVLATLLLVSGKWFIGALHLVLAAYDIRTYVRGEHSVDVTEIFRQIKQQKNIRLIKLVFYLLSFVLIIYRLVESAVTSLLTPEGRHIAHNILRDAAASM